MLTWLCWFIYGACVAKGIELVKENDKRIKQAKEESKDNKEETK